jgi:hypothetical protein
MQAMSEAERIASEQHRTKPDFVVFTPGSVDGATHDTGNEQVSVFAGPDGSLMAVWTQMTCDWSLVLI